MGERTQGRRREGESGGREVGVKRKGGGGGGVGERGPWGDGRWWVVVVAAVCHVVAAVCHVLPSPP